MGCLFDCFRSRNDQSTADSFSQPNSRLKSRRGHDSKKSLSALFPSEVRATPIEISKASKNLDTKRGEHSGSSQFHSSNFDAVFHIDEKTTEPCEEVGRSLVTLEQTPSSCLPNARNSSRIYSGSNDGGEESIGTAFRDEVDRTGKVLLTAANITGKSNSVRIELDIDQSYSSSSSKNSTSTTLKLSDEIQTPGNIFPENMDSQLVQACKKKTKGDSPISSSTCGGKLEQSSDETYQIGIRTPGDRPIIGNVALHWNEEEQSEISTKSWDGNGIPNSSSKYKEDQKVSWHGTPFEKRLEKALSKQTSQGFIPPRRKGIEQLQQNAATSEEVA